MPVPRRMTVKSGLVYFALCWFIAWGGITLLRWSLIPAEERECHTRVRRIQEAVDAWDRVHPEEPIRHEIDMERLRSSGFLHAGDVFDPGKHYYFVGETAHGWRVRCNRHEDNPLLLRWTGVTLLALVLWVALASVRRTVLFPPS